VAAVAADEEPVSAMEVAIENVPDADQIAAETETEIATEEQAAEEDGA